MVFGRRKHEGRTGDERDPFAHLEGERNDAESGSPWFLDGDDDAPELDVQAGISSNLDRRDLTGRPVPPEDEPGDR
jgi:hypothetical protein